MRPLRAGWLTCALLAVVSAAPLFAQSIEPAAAREDFDVLWKSIREAHGGLNRHVSPTDLDRRVAAHRARIDKPMEMSAFAGLLQESVSELRDGHMRMEPDSATQAALATATRIPLRFVLEDRRLVVTFNDSPSDSTIRPGMTIVSINGRRDRLNSSGSSLPESRATDSSKPENGSCWRAISRRCTGSTSIAARRTSSWPAMTSGRQVSATLPGITESTRRQVTNPVNATISQNIARLDGPPGNVALEFLNGGPVARLRVRAFDGQAFTATLDSAFRALRDRGTTSMILDLRGNGGGVDEYGAALVSQFTDKPFRYFDYIHVTTIAPSFATWLPRTFDAMRAGTVADPAGGFRITSTQHRGVAEQAPASTPFLGKLVVLIDGGDVLHRRGRGRTAQVDGSGNVHRRGNRRRLRGQHVRPERARSCCRTRSSGSGS